MTGKCTDHLHGRRYLSIYLSPNPHHPVVIRSSICFSNQFLIGFQFDSWRLCTQVKHSTELRLVTRSDPFPSCEALPACLLQGARLFFSLFHNLWVLSLHLFADGVTAALATDEVG
jgi:hypothetical protein